MFHNEIIGRKIYVADMQNVFLSMANIRWVLICLLHVDMVGWKCGGKNEKMQKLVSIINFDVFQQQNESLYIYKVAIYLFNLLARDRAEDFQ